MESLFKMVKLVRNLRNCSVQENEAGNTGGGAVLLESLWSLEISRNFHSCQPKAEISITNFFCIGKQGDLEADEVRISYARKLNLE